MFFTIINITIEERPFRSNIRKYVVFYQKVELILLELLK